MKFNVEVYEYIEKEQNKISLVGYKNSNFQAMWIGRQSYTSAATIINFVKSLKSLGIDELTKKTIEEIAKEYRDIAIKKVEDKMVSELKADVFNNDSTKEDIIYSFIKSLTGADKLVVFFEKVIKYQAFTDHSGMKKIIGRKNTSEVFARVYDQAKSFKEILTIKEYNNTYTHVGTFNYSSNYEFAKESAMKYVRNTNNIEFYQPYSLGKKDISVGKYLVYA